MNGRVLLAACLLLHSCTAWGWPRAATVALTWPVVEAPVGAAGVTYEIRVWRVDRGAPVSEVTRRTGLTNESCNLSTNGWPEHCVWSVRAHWLQNGQPRQSRWLDAGYRPILGSMLTTADLASI